MAKGDGVDGVDGIDDALVAKGDGIDDASWQKVMEMMLSWQIDDADEIADEIDGPSVFRPRGKVKRKFFSCLLFRGFIYFILCESVGKRNVRASCDWKRSPLFASVFGLLLGCQVLPGVEFAWRTGTQDVTAR